MFGLSVKRISVAVASALAGVAMLGGAALAWTGPVDGQPTTVQLGAADGYYIWHNDREDKFHLRTTDSAGVFAYSGVLRTDGRFHDVEVVRKELVDHVQVGPDGHTIVFRFVTAEGIDGIDFNVAGGRYIEFRLSRNGSLIDPSSIHLGVNGVHPRRNPFWIFRNGHHRDRSSALAGVAPAETPTAAENG